MNMFVWVDIWDMFMYTLFTNVRLIYALKQPFCPLMYRYLLIYSLHISYMCVKVPLNCKHEPKAELQHSVKFCSKVKTPPEGNLVQILQVYQ